jgi:hypothetical protein
VRTDQPSTADALADREALPERTSDRLELEQRLGRLPPGHPSSPVEADGTPKPPEPGLRRYELTEAHPPADTDKRPLTDAEHAEHVKEVCALPDKARADIDLSVPDEEPSERLDEEQVPQPDQKLAAGAGQELAAREGVSAATFRAQTPNRCLIPRLCTKRRNGPTGRSPSASVPSTRCARASRSLIRRNGERSAMSTR